MTLPTSGRKVGRAISAPLFAAAAAATAGAAGAVAARRSGFPRRVGASTLEARTRMPADDLITEVDVQNDSARLLSAPPEQVWDWLTILGRDPSGLYSSSIRQRLADADPDVPPLQVGERFWVHPGLAMRVVEVEPGRSFALVDDPQGAPADHEPDVTWVLLLRKVPRPGRTVFTRLRIRERHARRNSSDAGRAPVGGVGTAINTLRLLSRLESLAG